MYKTAVYPGSFDPITYGHLDLIKRSLCIFDRIVVAVAANRKKPYLFSQEERVKIIKKILKVEEGIDEERVDVVGLKGLLVKYVESIDSKVIIRGLRAVSDFEYELQLATTNRMLNPDIETIFMMTAEKYSFLSSTIVKEISRLGGDVSGMVHPIVADELLKIHSRGEDNENIM